jgi:23S rRNA (cytosine1962-C5)-methyltransferase
MPNLTILTTKPSKDYELLDSGEGEKLERYGEVILSRPDPQALWRKNLPETEWAKAQAKFAGQGEKSGWIIDSMAPKKWKISFGGFRFLIKPSSFKHVGLFPEQLSNWEWLSKTISNRKEKVSVLNLFAYTGGATLAAAKAGAEVCHLDGSKAALSWARENAKISGLGTKPIRWILDDSLGFVEREIRRGRAYDGFIMDPPTFGHGPSGELWKIERDFLKLFDLCLKLFSEKPLFFLINGYASGYSAIAYGNNLLSIKERYGGEIEVGELTIEETSGKPAYAKATAGRRLLPCGIFSRWRADC